MHILSILLFCFSANADAFIIGLACSLQGTHISSRDNLKISLICAAGTAAAMVCGHLIGGFLSPGKANLIGSILLIVLGIYFTFDSLKAPDSGQKNTPEPQTGSGVTALAFALSLNNFALGLGASITGLPILLTSVLTFASCYLLLLGGQKTGSTFLSRYLGRFAPVLSGVIILLLGIYEILV